MKVARPRPPLPLPNSESCFVTHFHILVSYTPRTGKKWRRDVGLKETLSLCLILIHFIIQQSVSGLLRAGMRLDA